MESPQTLVDLVANAAQNYPDNMAFSSQSAGLTFKELDERSNGLANLLRKEGIQKGDRVGVLLSRTVRTAIAVYGILKSGGVIVPLNQMAPSEWIKTIIADCEIRMLISEPNLSRNHEALSKSIRILGKKDDEFLSWDQMEVMSTASVPQVELEPNDPAYLMYTSGSTGNPKGILHTHFSGIAYAVQSAELYDLSPSDRIGNVAPLFFDQSTFGYFSSVYSGSCTYIFSDGELIMPKSLSMAISSNELTVLYSVPSFFNALVSHNPETIFDKVRWVLYGGESFPIKSLNRLFSSFPQSKVSNVYGPTEVNQCTYYHLTGPSNDSVIPLGQIWENTDYLIMREDGSTSKRGSGELLISSTTMMREYWNRPELNAKVFYNEERTGKRYYRTGDNVSLNEKGELIFSGRSDRLVKVKGYRAELDFIENVIQKSEQVKEVAVILVPQKIQNELCAFIVLNEGHEFNKFELEKMMMRYVPRYHTPDHYIMMESLPLSSSGKVSHKELLHKIQMDRINNPLSQ